MRCFTCPKCTTEHLFQEAELEFLASAVCGCGQDLLPTIFPPKRRGFKIRPLVAWYDLWVGAYWDRKQRVLYVLPVPCVGIVLEFPQ